MQNQYLPWVADCVQRVGIVRRYAFVCAVQYASQTPVYTLTHSTTHPANNPLQLRPSARLPLVSHTPSPTNKKQVSYLTPNLAHKLLHIPPQHLGHLQRRKMAPLLMLFVPHQIGVLLQNMLDPGEQLVGEEGEADGL